MPALLYLFSILELILLYLLSHFLSPRSDNSVASSLWIQIPSISQYFRSSHSRFSADFDGNMDCKFIASLFLVHSFGFYTCTLTFVLMIFERFLLCFNPFFYEDKDWNFPRFSFVICIVSFPFVVCIVMILQDDVMKMVSSFTMALVEGTSAWMLILCHRKSQEYYTTRFMVVPLNVRYQASKVIELTHALIPICYLGFLVKIGAFAVFFVSHNSDESTFVYCQIAFRMICSSYSLMEPIVLISRVKIIHRRFRLIIKRSKVNSVDYIPSDYNPQSYFNALRDQWGR